MYLLWEEEIAIKSGDRNFYLLLDLFLEIKNGMLLYTKNKRNQYTKQHLKLALFQKRKIVHCSEQA